MSDKENPGAQAGSTGAIDVAAITKSVTEQVLNGLKTTLADITKNQQVLADTVAEMQKTPGKAAAGKSDGSAAQVAGLTAESVAKLVADQLAAFTAGQTKSAQRQAFIAEKLKDVPAIYHGQLGDDPTKFAEQEQAIRGQVKTDLEKLGVKAGNLGGGDGGSAPGNDGGSGSGGGSAGAGLGRRIGGVTPGVAKFAESIKIPS